MEGMNCIVETPKGYGVKYNYDTRLARMELSKVLPAGLVFPFDFGFIPGTIGEDGDPLDVVIMSEFPSFPGCAVKCRIIGGIKAIQRERNGDKMRNDRYIAIPVVSVMYKNISKINQLPAEILQELTNFFINYNQQAGKRFKPLSFIHTGKALKAINDAQDQPEPTKLIQLLLPLYDNNGKPFPERFFTAVNKKLIKEFGGVTSYVQSPVLGLWKKEQDKVAKDRIIIYEVMVSKIDRSFWKQYKNHLQEQFCQKELVIRQTEIGLL